jgi:hypothetical protein
METITKIRPSRISDRRREKRVTPDPFLVIRLASGNAGIVLDVSQGGLGLLASAPLEETQAIYFEISGRSTPGCGPGSAGAGQVMWKDATGKRAGLKFTALPEELRTLIGTCFQTAETSTVVRTAQIAESARQIGEESAPPISTCNPRRLAFVANAITCAVAGLIALGIWYPVAVPGAFKSLLKNKPQVIQSLLFRRAPHAHDSLDQPAKKAAPAFAERLSPLVPLADENLPFPPLSPKQRRPFQLETIANLDGPKSTGPMATEAADKKAAHPERGIAPPVREDESRASLAPPRELLLKDTDSETQAKDAQLLWQAVAKGNVQAEIDLANLYLLGQGVAKSCSQARVLLTAAQNRKSELAAQKLGDLSKYGCG